ncbi:TetR/AcrR family transcriptional regulator [Sphingobium sp. EM0848]|uniref:TetR/AcrR family transcriptional regulator n=1 Tax=Sphingobium sp. EM0848 TaxID=2743473 RepID=UPI00159C1D14|nr:TetR/AcrR family transcriptional regulator [Sphingobium sp. EM0848]
MTGTCTAELILDAGIALLAEAGPRAATVRSVAERAGVPPPTLQHHFPTKMLLLRGIYGRAIARHVQMSEDGLARFADLTERPELICEIAIALLGEWRGRAGEATAVVLHMLAQAVRDPAWTDLARDWAGRSIACMAHTLNCGDNRAEFLIELLAGLALTSAPKGFRLESDILNRELINFVCDTRHRQTRGQWRRLFRSQIATSLAASSSTDDLSASRMVVRAALDAGITIMAEAGAEALSYRAIATRAGVALSSVLYNFPTHGALAMAVYNEIHRRFAMQTTGQQLPVTNLDEQIVALFTPMIVDDKAGNAPLVLASCELFLTAWWDSELTEQAWTMRLARGTRGENEGDFTAHFLSLWSIGLSLVQLARHHADPRAEVANRLRAGLICSGFAT